MKDFFFLPAVLLLLSACGEIVSPPTPTPTSTFTPAPTATKTPVPTPTVETGPENTEIKTDYNGDKYSVDAQGKPAYWYDEKTDKWQKFEPIDFKLWPVDRIIENKVLFSSRWYEEEFKRAIAEGVWQPQNPNHNYMKMPTAPEGSPERLEQERYLWWINIEDNDTDASDLGYDVYGRNFYNPLTDSANERFTYDKYPIQGTIQVNLICLIKSKSKS